MKKFLYLLLSCLLITVGCSNNNTATETTTTTTEEQKVIRLSGLNGGYGTAGWEAAAKAFEEETGIKVELTLEKNIAETLRPIITSGRDVPDLIYLAVGSEGKLTDTMIAEKQILDITDVLSMTVPGETTKVSEKILPGFTQSLTSSPYQDGKLYLSPILYSPCGVFFDKGLFTKNNWEIPTTFDEMWELSTVAEKEGIALFTYPGTGYFDAFFSALLNETAGPDVYEKLMTYDLESWKLPQVREAFDIVGELAKRTEKTVVANANGPGFIKNQQLILDDKALFIPNGTWLPGEMEDAERVETFEWGFMALPAVKEGGDRYSTTFIEQIYIPKNAENIEEAKQFIAFLYSDKATQLFIDNNGGVMPTVNASKYVSDSDKLYYEIYDTGAKANAVGFAAVEPIEGLDLTSGEGILYGTINSVVSGDKTVDDWYNAVIDAVTKYSEKMGN